MQSVTGRVRVEEVDMAFPTEDSQTTGMEVRATPVAFVEDIDEFLLEFLNKVDQ